MSEVAAMAHTAQFNPLVVKAVDTLRLDAYSYAEKFYVPVACQEVLPPFEAYGRLGKLNTLSESARKYLAEPVHEGSIGGNEEFVRWEIASRACLAGMFGDVYVGQKITATERSILSTSIHADTGPMPTQKTSLQTEIIFNPDELQRFAAHWYMVGSQMRLDGYIASEQRKANSEEVNNEWPLLSECLDYFAESQESTSPYDGRETQPFVSRFALAERDGGVETRNKLRELLYRYLLGIYPAGWDDDNVGVQTDAIDELCRLAGIRCIRGVLQDESHRDDFTELEELAQEVLTYGALIEHVQEGNYGEGGSNE